MKRALFLAPHGDEAHVGAGGTIARLLAEGDVEVFVMALSNADKSLPVGHRANTVYRELREACGELAIPERNVVLENFETRRFPEKRQEILQGLIDWRNANKPDVVFAPSLADIHQDHAAIATEATRAFRKSSSVYGYDFGWNIIGPGSLNLFVELSQAHVEKKMRALTHFKSQQLKRNNSTTPEYAHSLAIIRGNQIEAPYAEAFEVIRDVRRVGRGLLG